MTLALSRWSRRKALIALMAIFTLGNLLSAMAPNHTTLLLARLVTSLNHGAFFGLFAGGGQRGAASSRPARSRPCSWG